MFKLPKINTANLSQIDISIGHVSLTQRAFFAKTMSVLLKSGVPIIEALAIAEDSTTGRLKKIIAKTSQTVAAGKPFSDALAEHPKDFAPLFINICKVGESSGRLGNNLTTIAEQLEKEHALKSKIKSAMLYPLVILVAAVVVGIFMVAYILPKIVPLFRQLEVDLPVSTQVLIWISDLVIKQGLYLGIGITILLFFCFWFFSQKFTHPFTHWIQMHLPFVGVMTQQVNLALFCRTLGSLLNSGVSIDEAVIITTNTMGNYYYQKVLKQTYQSIVHGDTLSAGLSGYPKYFPHLATKMISVGEKSGNLDANLTYLSEYYEREVDNKAKTLPAIIEPILLMIIGLAVGFLALSIMTPIFRITSGIRR
jgi:type IV pilus assembly protein PilC